VKNNRGAVNLRWIEEYCLYPFGPDQGKRVKLTMVEQHLVRHVYDSFPQQPQVTGPLAGYLTLLHLCGVEGRQTDYRPTFDVDVWTIWNAAGPELKEVLQREGANIICPALGTRFPVSAAA
jgi:hypothetical protein